MNVKFRYNDKDRFGQIFEPESAPRFGTRLPAVVLSGFFGVRIDGRVYRTDDLEITDIFEDEDGVVRIVGTCGNQTFDEFDIEPGNAWLCWHDGEFYFEVMEEFHPKTYKVDKIDALQISRTPTQPQERSVDAPPTGG